MGGGVGVDPLVHPVIVCDVSDVVRSVLVLLKAYSITHVSSGVVRGDACLACECHHHRSLEG